VSKASMPQEGIVKSVRGNRRATVRYRCAPATLGKVYLSEDREFQRACVLNLSMKGIGMQLGRRLDLGQFIMISIKTNDGLKTFELGAQVVHCDPMLQDEWYVGCELTLALTPDELEQLL
jgi:hypothetical protein